MQKVITDVRVSRDGQLIASASWDGSTRVWSLQTGEALAVLCNEVRVKARATGVRGHARHAT